VLDLLVTRYWMFEKFPNETPQVYTRMRSATVCNATFAFIAAELGLQQVIYHHSRTLSGDMASYVKECLEMCKFDLKTTNALPASPWPLNFDAYEMQLLAYPKVLSDVFEALIGAIYLDLYAPRKEFKLKHSLNCFVCRYCRKGDIVKTWSVVQPLLIRMLNYVCTPTTVPTHPVSNLYTWAGRNRCQVSLEYESI